MQFYGDNVPKCVPPPDYMQRTNLSMFRVGVLLLLLLQGGLCAQTNFYVSPTFSEAFLEFGNQERERIFFDYGNLYNCNNVKNFGVVLIGAGILANTEMDHNFQRWYGKHIRSGATNDFSKVSKQFGEGIIFVPMMAGAALTYRFSQRKWGLQECTLGEFTDRSARGYLVGAPALFTFQRLLGGARPCNGNSYWRPFRRENSVSGHAFMGAVPFITAAQMTDNPCIKGLFYTLSVFTGWSRVNDDRHYLSQVVLGWYLAYLSVRAVSMTESINPLPQGLTIFPVCGDGSIGIGLHMQY